MKKLLLFLLLATACSAPGELEPGIYVCKARASGFEDLEPHRLDSETADARMVFSLGGTGIAFTSTEGQRVTLMSTDPPGWWCEKETS